MDHRDFSKTIIFNKSAKQVFEAINDVYSWWSRDFKGTSKQVGDEFEVWFEHIHYSKQRIVEMLTDKKVSWLVTESDLSFLKRRDEWTGTTIVFELSENDGKTTLSFTHIGLNASIECFKDCSAGWDHFLLKSLVPMINEDAPNPNTKLRAGVGQ